MAEISQVVTWKYVILMQKLFKVVTEIESSQFCL